MTLRERIAAAVALAVLATALIVAAAAPALAGPRPRIGPHQVFSGLVNGHRATSGPVTISVQCFGPIVPGETGHPSDGQTVEVRPASSTDIHSGSTGDAANMIEAFFGAPPPDARPARRSTVSFKRYYLAKPIPTSIELPCSGTGQVTFVPFPRSVPSSRPATVAVQYVGQP